MCIINSIVLQSGGGFIPGVIIALYLIMYNVHTCTYYGFVYHMYVQYTHVYKCSGGGCSSSQCCAVKDGHSTGSHQT